MTSNINPIEPGRYQGRPTGGASVYENDKRSLVLAMDIMVEGLELRWWCTLATEKDGINERNIDHLKECFGAWDGIDPFWFQDNAAALPDYNLDVTIELRPGTKNPQRLFPSILYVDPPGKAREEMPVGDRRALLAKYGAKFRAIAGGASSSHRPQQPAHASHRQSSPGPAPASARGNVPARPARQQMPAPSTEEACWSRWVEQNQTMTEKEIQDGWFSMLDRLMPGKDPGGYTLEDWGRVMADINDYVPF